MLIGLFDGMRPDRASWDAADINRLYAELVADSEFAGLIVPHELTEADVARVRALRSALLERWGTTAPGDALELAFDRKAGRH